MTKKKDVSDEKQKSAMGDLLAKNKDYFKLFKAGDTIQGKVINISRNAVQLDLDGKATGVVRGYELTDEGGIYSDLKVGDMIEATVIDMENETGEVELSFRHASHKKIWDELNELYKNKETVGVKIKDANKGGLIIELSRIQGFLPTSQLAPEHYPRVEGGSKDKILEILKEMIGKELKVKVIGLSEEEEKLIVSEKATTKQKLQEMISNYKVGDIVEGKISGIVDFGIFVKFDKNLEGLVHLSELAWQRIDHPKSLFKTGDKVKAEIISIDNSKISLSIKNLIDDPWKNVAKKYKIGQRVSGKILKIEPFGLFVELDKDIHGLCHISEISDSPIKNIRSTVNLGDVLNFEVVSIEPQEHRLGLSLKKTTKIKEEKPAEDKEIKTVDKTKEKPSKSTSKKETGKKDEKSKNIKTQELASLSQGGHKNKKEKIETNS